MHEESFESLSATMDGEATPFEARRVVERCANEQQLADKWQRYHLAQQALQGADVAPIADRGSFVANISAAIDAEPAYHEEQVGELTSEANESTAKTWWKPFASMAMAASVTAVVILGGQAYNANDGSSSSQFQQAYTIPSVQGSSDVVRTQYGATYSGLNQKNISVGSEPEVLRLSQGLSRYIDQHQHLLEKADQPEWETLWMPEGFTRVKHEVLPYSEVMLYSNGKNTISVSVEPLGRQAAPEGVTQAQSYVAVGKRKSDCFVTVVGDVPLMIADRIASSVKSVH
ncbi:MucB/RseB C-terminal domain-containing protein [Neptunomonas marina]|uniref:Anti sigma-E protein RseA N-terminal domain-containing protein n=1 Tax=Neptunomonas marina TaxID=1815562 RepID=A0A437Q8H7_9GAMM|nr:MucB/RseB C-terminal domain-containing protein [Neptunomonas marina]RVU30818.1 hypothetical protein EOE65_10960 [Neptunomonas marina]